MTILGEKFKEVVISVLPITIIVLILHFTLTPLEIPLLLRFLLGAFLIIIGLSIFLVGVDKGITPIGNLMGSTLTKTNKIWIVAGVGLALGFFISIAEPDLHILANQVSSVTANAIPKITILVIVSVGIAILLSLGLIRIVYNIPLYKMITVLYLIIFVIAIFASPEFVAISFDASGAVTGALVVPFILALGLGVSSLKKDSKASEKDSFGLVAITAVGAIISVMIMNIVTQTDEISGSLEYSISESDSIFRSFIHELPTVAGEIFIALLPIIMIFLIFQIVSFKLPRKTVSKIFKGLVYTYLGLVLFLVGVNAGFMDVGSVVGFSVASLENKLYIVIIGFIIGLVTVLAEPSVHVLTHQIEEVTSGYVKRKMVLLALSIGVGMAISLSMIRIIIDEVQLWHYLLPGYFIAVALTYVVPKLFVGMGFDSGTVSSGPMTATFILAFGQGVAEAIEGADVLREGFGIIAMVTLAPMIAVQVLGLIFKVKSAKGGIKADDTELPG